MDESSGLSSKKRAVLHPYPWLPKQISSPFKFQQKVFIICPPFYLWLSAPELTGAPRLAFIELLEMPKLKISVKKLFLFQLIRIWLLGIGAGIAKSISLGKSIRSIVLTLYVI
jgi:hypothetical protein